jgi:DNA polymerase III epsilon subunit-like protein
MGFRNPVLCGFDIETTGFDKEKDHITEIGWVIKRWREPKPIELKSFFVQGATEIPDDVRAITKITPEFLKYAGHSPLDVYSYLMQDLVKYKVQYLVGHNSEAFDIPFLVRYAERRGVQAIERIKETRSLDTMVDIDYPLEFTSRSLVAVCATLGFCNPFAHAALFDAFATLKVLDHFSLEHVIGRSLEPWVVLRAMVKPPYNDNAPRGEKETDKAKARKFRWQDCGDGKEYDKCWVKRVKKSEVAKEIEEAPFRVVQIND